MGGRRPSEVAERNAVIFKFLDERVAGDAGNDAVPDHELQNFPVSDSIGGRALGGFFERAVVRHDWDGDGGHGAADGERVYGS